MNNTHAGIRRFLRKVKKTVRNDDRKGRLICEKLAIAFRDRRINGANLKKLSIFPKCRVIYNRIRKNGNSSVMIALNYLENGRLLDSVAAKHQVGSIVRASDADLQNLDSFRFLVVVRDPYSRVLSAFLDKFPTEGGIQKYGRFDHSQSGFRDFLSWLQDGGLERNSHWDLQVKSLVLPLDCFTDVVRFENYDAEMTKFLCKIKGLDCHKHITQAFTFGQHHRTNASDRLRSFYNRETKLIVSRLYEEDFIALGYDVVD